MTIFLCCLCKNNPVNNYGPSRCLSSSVFDGAGVGIYNLPSENYLIQLDKALTAIFF